MSRHAQIEEISDSDSDPIDMDPSDFEPTNSKFPIQARQQQQPSSSSSASLLNPSQIPFSQSQLQQLQQQQSSYATTKDLSPFKAYQCIYPVYFDARRSRAEGRRVGKDQAVENPLARDIVDAVQLLGLKALFEPGKIHPKDWSNPGRVKVLVKLEGRAVRPGVVKNSQLVPFCFTYIFSFFLKKYAHGVYCLLLIPLSSLFACVGVYVFTRGILSSYLALLFVLYVFNEPEKKGRVERIFHHSGVTWIFSK